MDKKRTITLLQRLLAEFIGTFALVFVGTGAIVVNAQTNGGISFLGIALAFGLVVMIVVYAIGHISGAHINPAVTIAFTVARHFPLRDVVPYIIAQVVGAITASFVLRAMFGNVANLGATLPVGGVSDSFFLELLITFILMFVIVSVATDTRAVGEAAAIAIGGSIGVLALMAGLVSGGSMNPARSLGPAIASGAYSGIWIYLVAPTVGAIIGALVYQLLKERRWREPEVGFGTEEEKGHQDKHEQQ